ncbi:hypothetical protein BpHYR1_005929 [Brachionus plicatilis]|uniref:Uncharacterized protein n=1 Tax=Brachionus plicatilis TaxID=10195 RepID=A0A3M7S2V5_BRAPC|nr:hypothetical protein BpHYR1_005929 [Brachionus plicatilis]
MNRPKKLNSGEVGKDLSRDCIWVFGVVERAEVSSPLKRELFFKKSNNNHIHNCLFRLNNFIKFVHLFICSILVHFTFKKTLFLYYIVFSSKRIISSVQINKYSSVLTFVFLQKFQKKANTQSLSNSPNLNPIEMIYKIINIPPKSPDLNQIEL